MPHLNFAYDEAHYPEDSDLPDPQVDPVIPGSRVPINKVGVSGVDLPVNFVRRDGTIEKLTTSVSLYGSLDNPNAKGLNLSRFPIVMHEQIANHVSIDGITHILDELQKKQGSKDVYCKMKFKYPWTQKALRTRKELPHDALERDVFKIVDGVKLSHEKARKAKTKVDSLEFVVEKKIEMIRLKKWNDSVEEYLLRTEIQKLKSE